MGVCTKSCRKFNHKTDRHPTAVFKTEIDAKKKVFYVLYYGFRNVIYDIIADFEKREGRAPYHIEAVMIYQKQVSWYTPFPLVRFI